MTLGNSSLAFDDSSFAFDDSSSPTAFLVG